MNKHAEKDRITIVMPPKLNTQVRMEAVKLGMNLNETIFYYRELALKWLEREKEERKAEKENKRCDQCGQLLINEVKKK